MPSFPRHGHQHHPDIQTAQHLVEVPDPTAVREHERDVTLFQVPVKGWLEVSVDRMGELDRRLVGSLDDFRLARRTLDKAIRRQRTMVKQVVMRILPSGLTSFFQPVPPESADAAISLPPGPTPPVVIFRFAVVPRRHLMGSMEVVVVASERIGGLVQVEELLAFDTQRGNLKPILVRIEKTAQCQGPVVLCLPMRRDAGEERQVAVVGGSSFSEREIHAERGSRGVEHRLEIPRIEFVLAAEAHDGPAWHLGDWTVGDERQEHRLPLHGRGERRSDSAEIQGFASCRVFSISKASSRPLKAGRPGSALLPGGFGDHPAVFR